MINNKFHIVKKTNYINKNFAAIIYLLLLAIQLNGCATTEIVPINTRQVDSTIEDYYLRTGDILEIKFFTTPELDENVTIRPDGKISLQLIGDIRAEGFTGLELNKVLAKEYDKQLNNSSITVIVKTFAGQNIYIGGEVRSSKELLINGKLNALQAVFLAGGFTKFANKGEVVIISRGPDNKPVARDVNLKKALKGKLLENEYLLRPFDIVYVPKTRLAKINDFTNHIYSIIPARIWRGLYYEQGSSFNLDWERSTETPSK